MSDPNERVLGVHELSVELKRNIEALTVGLWVEGEVGRLQRHPSGHVYFRLKDEERDAVIDCALFRREAMRYGKLLEEGARVQLRGRASLYAPQGRLQWIADAVRASGQGALLLELAKLREKLTAEGLFAIERKRPLPTDPRVVGVVTSRSGAVLHDILTVSRRRGPVRIVLAPAQVQGEGAAQSLLVALDRLERLAELDVIIVGRGGGSQEDLSVFNDERVVRRIAGCRVPVVSAIGHEVDVTLSDFAADVRAATPSQAAELIVPDAAERRRRLSALVRHMGRAARSVVERAALDLARCERRMGDPRLLLAEPQQALDELRERMRVRQRAQLVRERRSLLELQNRLMATHPRVVVLGSRARLLPLETRLGAAMSRAVALRKGQLATQARALDALSPLAILGRGYALAFDSSGAAVRDASLLRPGDPIELRVARGSLDVRVENVRTDVALGAAFEHEP